MLKRHLARTQAAVLLAVAALVGCQAPPVPPPGPGGPGGQPAPGTPAVATQHFTFDVDPMRGATFERPTDAGALSQLQLAIDSPEVSYDPTRGQTTVRLHATNAGSGLANLALRVGEGAHLVSAPTAPLALAASGGNQALDFVFHNPGGDSFSFEVTFAGTPTGARALMAVAPVSSATASSTYGNLAPGNAIDGNLSTQWSNDGYRVPEAWLRLDTGATRPLSAVTVKMPPQSGGAYYRIETSTDGVNFTPVTGNLKNTSWTMELKVLNAGSSGRYVRFHFFNDAASPQTRFAVFEAKIEAGGGTAPTPTPTAGATPTPSPSASAAPPAAGAYGNTFEQYAVGAAPSDFVDPIDEGYSYSWMPRVRWYVTNYNGSKQYMHDGLASRSVLNFRRYRGTALGTQNGRLPARYFATVDVTPIRSNTYSPTGDQGSQFYYLDPTHYFELLIKPNLFEVWVANGAVPFTSQNWQRLYFTSATTTAGQRRRLAVEIDTATNTARCYLDGALKATLRHPMLTNQTHFFALRGTGNVVVHDNLTIQPR